MAYNYEGSKEKVLSLWFRLWYAWRCWLCVESNWHETLLPLRLRKQRISWLYPRLTRKTLLCFGRCEAQFLKRYQLWLVVVDEQTYPSWLLGLKMTRTNCSMSKYLLLSRQDWRNQDHMSVLREKGDHGVMNTGWTACLRWRTDPDWWYETYISVCRKHYFALKSIMRMKKWTSMINYKL